MSKNVPWADFGPHSVDKAWHGLLWAENHHKQNFVNPENPENPEGVAPMPPPLPNYIII